VVDLLDGQSPQLAADRHPAPSLAGMIPPSPPRQLPV
jgi:hypothetical protein